MKRVLLLVALMVGAFASFGGVAMAEKGDIRAFEIGGQFNSSFTVLNANNQRVDSGPKVAFTVTFRCAQGQDIVMVFHAQQDRSTGAPAEASGSIRRNCTGNVQRARVVLTKNSGSPNFNDNNPLQVEGVAGTINNSGDLTDLAYDNETLTPAGG